MDTLQKTTVVLVYSTVGQYIPYVFAKKYNGDARWVGANPAEIEILINGPDDSKYQEAWDNVFDQARYHDKDGREWQLWQEGDLFAYTGDGEQWT